jgi:hypothetical protein
VFYKKETGSAGVHKYGKLTFNLILWLALWTAFTVEGIWAKAQEPDLPSFRSLHTDLLNPWATWCHESNGLMTGCFGTSWNHIGGPYSLVWYWFMVAVGLGGYVSFTQALFVLNIAFIGFLYRYRTTLLWPYLPTSWLFLVGYPQNIPILFLEVLGFWNPGFVLIAAFVKLPFGASTAVWRFVLTSPQSLHDPSNWMVYAVLVTWGIVALTWRRFLKKLLHSAKISSDASRPTGVVSLVACDIQAR